MELTNIRRVVTKEDVERHVRSQDVDALRAFDGSILEPRLSSMKVDLGCLVSCRDSRNVCIVSDEGTPLFLAVVLAVAGDGDEKNALDVVESLLRHCCVSVMSKAEEPVLDFVVDACTNRNNSNQVMDADTIRRMRAVMDVFVSTLVSADSVLHALRRVLMYGNDFPRGGVDDVPTALVADVLYVMERAGDGMWLAVGQRRIKPMSFGDVLYLACGPECRIESFRLLVAGLRVQMLAFRSENDVESRGVNGYVYQTGGVLRGGDTVLHFAARLCLRGAFQESKVKYLLDNGFAVQDAVRNSYGNRPRAVLAMLDVNMELSVVEFGRAAAATTYRRVLMGGPGAVLMTATWRMTLDLLGERGKKKLEGDVMCLRAIY